MDEQTCKATMCINKHWKHIGVLQVPSYIQLVSVPSPLHFFYFFIETCSRNAPGEIALPWPSQEQPKCVLVCPTRAFATHMKCTFNLNLSLSNCYWCFLCSMAIYHVVFHVYRVTLHLLYLSHCAAFKSTARMIYVAVARTLKWIPLTV